ncbi:hypothetical protein IAU60_004668 [Kwoniella sp. DSM 27419]
MQASSSGVSLGSSPPSELDIWGSTIESLLQGGRTLRQRGPAPPVAPDVTQEDPAPHPLAQAGPTPPTRFTDVMGDVSRPALKRLTTETERQVAESSRSGSEPSGSMRGSLDILRMSAVDEGSGEVEVLIHTVKPHESMAGIALLYGIDLATLRKVNKLWSSDSIHLRTHLYVPLDACRWNKASEVLVRGPGEGQVTLHPKGRDKGKGRARDDSMLSFSGPGGLHARDSGGAVQDSNGIVDISEDPWFEESNLHGSGSSSDKRSERERSGGPSATPPRTIPRDRSVSANTTASEFMPSTNIVYASQSPPQIPSTLTGLGHDHPSRDQERNQTAPRVLDVVRIPSSQLRFFPKTRPSESASRTSIDRPRDGRVGGGVDGNGEGTSWTGKAEDAVMRLASMALRRNSDDAQVRAGHGPSIVNDLSTLPPSLRGASAESPPRRSKTMVVRLRPPQSTEPLQTSSTLANRLSSLFTVPAPPAQVPFAGVPSSGTNGRIKSARPSLDSPRRSGPPTPSGADGKEEMELKPRTGDYESAKLGVTTPKAGYGFSLSKNGLGISFPSATGRSASTGSPAVSGINRNGGRPDHQGRRSLVNGKRKED